MKTVGRLIFIAAMVSLIPHAQAQCTAPCVTSFTITPGQVVGDNIQTAVGSVTAYLPPGTNQWILAVSLANVNFQGCLPPATLAGTYSCFVNGPSASVLLSGVNNQQMNITGSVIAYAAYENDPGITDNLLIQPVGTAATPPNQPDTSCPDCARGGKPINFTTGNTWISQSDYAIPGLGGGLSLTRTWNSLWPLMLPVQQVGLFGDSWTSNFEERIQALAGGVVQYWKGDGGRLFYKYNSGTGTYTLTAPSDDQTTLSVNSGTGVSTILQKDGTQRLFNSAGYLTSIIDRNGNRTTIAVDPANQNRISSVTDSAGRVLTFNYTNAKFPRLCTSISDTVGTAATYLYDSTGRLSSVTYSDNSQYVFQFNSSISPTLISQVNDSMGKTIEAETYDSQRRGLTSQQADGVNLVTVNQYTAGQTNIFDSRSNFSEIKFTTIAQRNHSWLSQGYGCASCGSNLPETVLLTPAGYRTSQSDPGQVKPTVFTYDSAGNVASVSMLANNPNSPTIWGTWNYTYNGFGEVLTATDPLGLAGDPNHTTVNMYDSAGDLLTTTTPSPDGGITAGSTTTFTPNSNGTINTIKDPLGNKTTITYYPNGVLGAGQIKTITDANNKITTYTYDARGNRLTIQDPVNGATKLTVFTYDSMNRLKTITYPGATSSVTFDYDWRGRRDWVQDQNGFNGDLRLRQQRKPENEVRRDDLQLGLRKSADERGAAEFGRYG